MIVGKQLDSCSAQDYSLAGDEGPLRYWWKKGPPTQMAYTARPRCRCRRRRHRRRSYRPCGWADHVLSLFKRVIKFKLCQKISKNPFKIAKIVSRSSQSDWIVQMVWIFFALKKIHETNFSIIIDKNIVGKLKFCSTIVFKVAKMAPEHQNCRSACPRDWEQNSLLSLLSEAKSRPLEAGKLRDRAFVKLSFLEQLMHTTC